MTMIGSQPSTGVPTLPDGVWTGWIACFRDWVAPTTEGALEVVFGVASVEVGQMLGRNVAIQYGKRLYATLYVLANWDDRFSVRRLFSLRRMACLLLMIAERSDHAKHLFIIDEATTML